MTETSLQYPVGRFTAPETVTVALRNAAISELVALPAAMRAAVQGLSSSQLETPYRDGGWNVREVVHHVPDSHMHAYCRIKFALTEESPTIRPYDEVAWTRLNDVTTVPVDVSLMLLDAVHTRLVACLKGLDESHFKRRFVHPDLGAQAVDMTVLRYAWHGRHHLAHITSLRSRMGW